jgi:MFS transporter, DHA3 family, macrolide efflux protein
VASVPGVTRLFNRHFILLWQGRLLGQLGSQAFLIGTTFYLLEGTGSATLVAGAMMAATLPMVIVGPVGGTIADRHSRRSIAIATHLMRSVATGALALLVLCEPHPTPRHAAAIVAVAAFNGVMAALFGPAFQALIPEVVPAGRLATANAVTQMSGQATTLTGQAIGGVLYLAWGPAGLLLMDSFSFGAAALIFFPLAPDRRRPPKSPGVRSRLRQYATETRVGLEYVWRRPGMTGVLAIFAGVNCLFMPVFVLLPFYVREVMREGPAWYGFLLAASAAGALIGSLVAGLTRAAAARAGVLRACLGGIAIALAMLAATASKPSAVAAFVVIGALSSVINVVVMTAFQAAVPSDVRGRVMSLVIVVSTAAVPIGMAIGGVLGDLWPESLAVIFAGCGAAIGLLAALTLRTTQSAELLDWRPTMTGGSR